MADRRDEFLIEMYRQCSAHLNRHILIPWQAVGLIGAALAAFVVEGKFENKPTELDFLITLAVVLCSWLSANLYDANNWFDRNLHIIGNIERQFLNRLDLKDIHPFFEKHRAERSGKVSLLLHFKVQLIMSSLVLLLVLGYHASRRITAGCFPAGWTWTLPYIAFVIGTIFVLCVREKAFHGTRQLLGASPGRELP